MTLQHLEKQIIDDYTSSATPDDQGLSRCRKALLRAPSTCTLQHESITSVQAD